MKSNPNPSFYPTLPYESLSSHMSIDKKRKEKKKNINIDLAVFAKSWQVYIDSLS